MVLHEEGRQDYPGGRTVTAEDQATGEATTATPVADLARLRAHAILEKKRLEELIRARIVKWAQDHHMTHYRIAQETGMSRTGVGNILKGIAESMGPRFIQWAVDRGI